MRTKRGTLPLAALVLTILSLPATGVEAPRLRPASRPIYTGLEDVGLSDPEGVACRGSVAVIADSGNSRLIRLELGESSVMPSAAWSFPELPYPVRVQIDGKGSVWVLDGQRHEIARLTPEGRMMGFLELGEDALPRSFRLGPGDEVYVLDVRSSLVRVLSSEGSPLRTIAFPDEAGFLSDLAVDAGGTVYAVDSVGHRVFAARKGEATLAPLAEGLEEYLDFATALGSDAQGRLFLVDQNGGGLVILGRDGSFLGRQSAYGWKPGFLRYPTDLCLLETRLLVADRGNNRVQIFDILD